jgi:hypothetical protein
MLVDAEHQVVGHADIERPIPPARMLSEFPDSLSRE